MPTLKEEDGYLKTLYNNILLKLKLNVKKLKMSENKKKDDKKKEKSIYGRMLQQHLKEETDGALKKAIKNEKQRRKVDKWRNNVRRAKERKEDD